MSPIAGLSFVTDIRLYTLHFALPPDHRLTSNMPDHTTSTDSITGK
jgi:hypothetical protein